MGRQNAAIDKRFLMSGEEMEISSSVSIEMVAPTKGGLSTLMHDGYVRMVPLASLGLPPPQAVAARGCARSPLEFGPVALTRPVAGLAHPT